MPTRRPPVLAIDGPAGTGKTVSAAAVARRLGFAYVDSGALYRAIALAALDRSIEGPDDPRIAPLLADLPVSAETGADCFRVRMDGAEVTDRLRSPEVGSLASKLAVHPAVRARVGEWLRELASRSPAVIEGRDIGTAVFPDADLKVFMTASLGERARRRALDMARLGHDSDVDAVARAIAERDERDTGREIAPLRRADDAVVVDTTQTDLNGQVRRILDAWTQRVPPRRRAAYAFDQALLRFGLGLFFGLRVEGVENVPTWGGVILASNHKSYLDPLLVGSVLPRESHYLAKKQLFSVPLLSSWIRRRGAVPIDRDAFDRRAIERCLGILRRGGALVVFPEGTRIRRPGLGPPREGIALLAARSGVPVVPVHVRGSWRGERRGLRRPGIRVRFGPALDLPPTPPGREGRETFPALARAILAGIARVGGVAASD